MTISRVLESFSTPEPLHNRVNDLFLSWPEHVSGFCFSLAVLLPLYILSVPSSWQLKTRRDVWHSSFLTLRDGNLQKPILPWPYPAFRLFDTLGRYHRSKQCVSLRCCWLLLAWYPPPMHIGWVI
jgi:hypothetical protein